MLATSVIVAEDLRMARKLGGRSRRIIIAATISVLVFSLTLSALVYLESIAVKSVLVPDWTSDHSNISATGVVTEIHPNFTSYGLGGPQTRPYHVFAEVIVVNLTQILWTTDGLNDSLAYWKSPHSLGVQFRDISIAYDDSDVPILAVGQTVEFSGFYLDVTDGVNSFFVTISPKINGSYLKLSDFPSPEVQPISPHYLRTIPDLFGNFSQTKIFLVDAEPRFGYYNETVKPNDPSFPEIHQGDPVFVLNVTLRNDYTEDDTPTGGFDYNNGSIIILQTQLYDKNGPVNGMDVTPPYPGGFHVSAQSYEIKRGETASFDIYLLTPNRQIDRFELYIYYIYSSPMP